MVDSGSAERRHLQAGITRVSTGDSVKGTLTFDNTLRMASNT
jgi:hypothetical protein